MLQFVYWEKYEKLNIKISMFALRIKKINNDDDIKAASNSLII